MFRRLKIKLILINVVVVVIISAFFMTGIYALMMRSMHRESDQLMQLIASDAGSNPGTYTARPKWQKLNYFYVKVNNSGDILETTQNIPVPREQLQTLIKEALSQSEQRGFIRQRQHGEHYRFLKAPLKNGQGLTIVFLNSESEERVIGHLLAAFAITGLGGIAVALLGSLFMANRALIPIKKSWEQQKNFIADASHELRTPLAVIQTNLDIVKSNPNEKVATQTVWLENIEAETKLMTKMVTDMLLLARADSHQLPVHMESFKLNEAAEEVLTPFEPVAVRRGLRLNKKFGQQIDFDGDQTRIKQLIGILIDNAIKYTPAGGEVSLEIHDHPYNIEIIVTDTGEGIEKEHLDKIFERFYRVDKARSRESGGTGLGLSIAEWIVKEHHGTIKVSSSPGAGTTFVVNLPKRK
ncbi:sensor histidine kinase [Thermincola potens]|uniref:histidine kinase n=1 Tax=Thermincola potens (strain JR) TaxID=635013 RepID=D5XC23_THEPJ|nr:ATP-binding protein [Thermincola potens]ADG83475.1 integral membrane sensor signal transduction histidine kinase [Thermincola potens JR]